LVIKLATVACRWGWMGTLFIVCGKQSLSMAFLK